MCAGRKKLMTELQEAYTMLRAVLLSAKSNIDDARFGDGVFYRSRDVTAHICANLSDLGWVLDQLVDAAEECARLAREGAE